MTHPSGASADVIIVGAGLAGATAATVLGGQGLRVILADAFSTYPACFKAEKLEPDQSDLLRKLGLLDAVLPSAGHIHEIWEAEDGRVVQALAREQFGILYQDMVNGVRDHLPPSVDLRVGRVRDIVCGNDLQQVTFADGNERTARLLVLACGTGGDLHDKLGIRKVPIQKEQSLAFGFDIARTDGSPFPFDALTYYPDGCADRIAYLSLFRIGDGMRANLFVCWSLSEAGTRNFVREPRAELTRLLPKLARVTGEFKVASRVETGRIDLYETEGHVQAGLVLVADAFQSVCPMTGMGLSKVLTDVDVLCHEYVRDWLSSPGMGVEKVARFYDHPRKRRVDAEHRSSAWGNRQMAINDHLFWRMRRIKRRWKMQASRLSDYFKLTRRLPA